MNVLLWCSTSQLARTGLCILITRPVWQFTELGMSSSGCERTEPTFYALAIDISHKNSILWPSTGGVQTVVRWMRPALLLTFLSTHEATRSLQLSHNIVNLISNVKLCEFSFWCYRDSITKSWMLSEACATVKPRRGGACSSAIYILLIWSRMWNYVNSRFDVTGIV